VLNEDPVVFMFDVDNTLLDNDRFAADLTARLDDDFGKPERERYWSLYAELRDRFGYADYLGALQAFRTGGDDHPALLGMSAFLLDYSFSERLYPRALAALKRLRTIGATVNYVMIEDKPQLLGAMKRVLGATLTTVFVRQGHYAAESDRLAIDPAPELTVEHIGDLCGLALADFHAATASRVLDADRKMSPATNFQERP